VGIRKLTVVAVVIGLLLAPSAAHSGGLYGPNALFLHPTAYLPEDRRATMGATYFEQEPRIYGKKETVEWVPVFVDQRLSKRLEAGLVYLRQSGFSRTWDSYGGLLKYQLSAEQERRPAVAVAIDYLGHRLRTASVCLVASKQFAVGGHAIRGHLGYLVTRRSDLPAPLVYPKYGETDHAPYAGLELFLTRELRLVGEVEARMKFYDRTPTTIALMWSASRDTGLGIGWVNTGRSAVSCFFVGVGYKIGQRR
jgi:hypothetical protein